MSEACKQHDHSGAGGQLWFYRDSNQVEVDLLAGGETELSAWEIKSAMTISSDFFKGLRSLDKGTSVLKQQSIIYCGDKRMTRKGVNIIPWNQLDDEFIAQERRSMVDEILHES